MTINSLKTLDLILSLSKDEAKLSGFFSSLLARISHQRCDLRVVFHAGR